MGIQDLSKLLNEKCPGSFFKVSLRSLAGKRIAIDMSNYEIKYMAIANKKTVEITDLAITTEPDRNKTINTWLRMFLDFIIVLLEYNITPVFCKDGKAPIEKAATKEKRREKYQDRRDKINEQKNLISTLDPLMLTPTMTEDLAKLLKQESGVKPDESDLLKAIVSGLGIPYIKGKDGVEGEKLCSALCREGYVEAVMSADMDVLTFGASLLLVDKPVMEYENGIPTKYMKGISLTNVLRELELTFPMFVDLCIMAGCDYNTRIKNIGIKKSYNAIKKHGGIDVYANNEGKDVSCLNYIKARELMAYIPSKDLIDCKRSGCEIGSYNIINILAEQGREILESVSLTNYLDRLVILYKGLIVPSSTRIIKPPCAIKLKIKGKGEDNNTTTTTTSNNNTTTTSNDEKVEALIKPMVNLSINIIKK